MALLDNSIPDRYENNPHLILLENYVLAAIGHLDPDKEKLLATMLAKTFGSPDWKKTLRTQFDLPPETDQNLKQLWKQAQEEATETQQSLTPEEFAADITDELFSNLGN